MKATCIKWISEEKEPQINNIYARSTPLNLTRTKNKPLLLNQDSKTDLNNDRQKSIF